MKVWQVGSGTGGRNLANRFIEYGVALIGPGEKGDFRKHKYEDSYVSRFATQVEPGDRIVLRSGKNVIKAIGIIAESGEEPPMRHRMRQAPVTHTSLSLVMRMAGTCNMGTEYTGTRFTKS